MIGNRHGAAIASATSDAGRGDHAARRATGTTATANALREDRVGTGSARRDRARRLVGNGDRTAIAGFATVGSERNETTRVAARAATAADGLGHHTVGTHAARLDQVSVGDGDAAARATRGASAGQGHQSDRVAAITAAATDALRQNAVGAVAGRKDLTVVGHANDTTTAGAGTATAATDEGETATAITTGTAGAQGLNAK